MSVLSKDDFLASVRARIGDDNSDEAIAFIENMSDTYDDLANGTHEGYVTQEEYDNLNRNWAEKYKNRFTEGGGMGEPNNEPTYEPEVNTEISINDLFK